MVLRKEASLRPKEREELKEFMKDREDMYARVMEVDALTKGWQENLLDLPTSSLPLLRPLIPGIGAPGSSSHPLSWDDDVRAREMSKVRKWKEQREFVETLIALIRSSSATDVLEDAFDGDTT